MRHKGLVIILLDAVSYPVLKTAVETGVCPFFRRLISQRNYLLKPYFPGLPAMSNSTEAELFYGTHDNIPGFNWFDRKNGRFIRSYDPSDAKLVETSYFRGCRPFLSGGSCLVGSYSGGAKIEDFSAAAFDGYPVGYIAGKLRFFLSVVSHPDIFFRSIGLFLFAWLRGVWTGISERSLKGQRIVMNDYFTWLFTETMLYYLVLAEITRGTRIIYTTFGYYDVLAHHHGLADPLVQQALSDFDRKCQRLYAIAGRRRTGYDFLFLSDHGMSPSVYYRDLPAESLDRYAAGCLGWPADSVKITYGYDRGGGKPETVRLAIVPNGSMAFLYFMAHPEHRMSRRELEAAYPGFIGKLLDHPAVGYILVADTDGRVLLQSRRGELYLEKGKIRGDTALRSELSADVLASLSDYCRFDNLGDITVFGAVRDGKIAAFEDHAATHGGMWGEMLAPFVLTDHADFLSHPDVPAVTMDTLYSAIREYRFGCL